jgi:hypothetical protein
MTKLDFLKSLPKRECVYIIFSRLTNVPYVVCNESTFEDEAFLFTDEAEALERAKELTLAKCPAVAVKAGQKEILKLFADLYIYGVTGLVVAEAHETFGLGNNALTDHAFLAQFLNSTGTFAVATVGEDAFSGATGEVVEVDETVDVDAMTGATVTSKAIIRCVNSAVAYVTGADADSGATSWGG